MDIKELENKVNLHKLAVVSGINVQTVYSWKYNGKIPKWREHEIEKALKKLGIKLEKEA